MALSKEPVTKDELTDALSLINRGVDHAIQELGDRGGDTRIPAQIAASEVWKAFYEREPLALCKDLVQSYQRRYGDDWKYAIKADITDLIR